MKKESTEYKAYSEEDYSIKAKKKKLIHPLLKNSSRKDLRRGIIYSEVLGKPKGW